MKLIAANLENINCAMDLIQMAKKHLKEQGIDQWQSGYPDDTCIKNDILTGKGFFIEDKNQFLGYLCIDFDGEPAYHHLNGTWSSDENYVVVHRLAFHEAARGKRLAETTFRLIEEFSRGKGTSYFRVDTDEANTKMQHILKKVGFSYCGTIWFDNSEKIAFDKKF